MKNAFAPGVTPGSLHRGTCGMTLIEVMIALCILMLSICAFARMHLAGVYANAYGECLTRATVLGNMKLSVLRTLPPDAAELQTRWHQDPRNPLSDGGRQFFRFWSVQDTPQGKDVTMYVAWGDRHRGRARSFTSREDFAFASCPRMELKELFLSPDSLPGE